MTIAADLKQQLATKILHNDIVSALKKAKAETVKALNTTRKKQHANAHNFQYDSYHCNNS